MQFSSAFVCLRLVFSSYHILPTNRRKFVAENVVLTNVLSTLSPSFSFSASFFVFIFTFLRETPLHFSLVLERCNPAHRRRQHTSDAQLGIHAQPPSLIILFFFSMSPLTRHFPPPTVEICFVIHLTFQECCDFFNGACCVFAPAVVSFCLTVLPPLLPFSLADKTSRSASIRVDLVESAFLSEEIVCSFATLDC